ncbi:MAG: histidine--tRNA ligase [Lachnospiraceae bacterium]|nr:histidine--tRNA ligase [Lachnospiraceae bacterium]
MDLIKKSVTGMKDILPDEMELRDYVIGLVKEVYSSFGFQSIQTPAVEHIENLCSNQGGENEKLIFRIMKRGEKLNIEDAKEENDLCDSGLRYDLTLPLSRYYASNLSKLVTPFKALQMGNVYRADRPQKGRFREFMQCDIDILGEPGNLAEIELINATTTLLSKLDLKDFRVRINDRRLLKEMAASCGFAEDRQPEVFIILDKMDKIGLSGVRDELTGAGFDEASVDKYISLFENAGSDPLEAARITGTETAQKTAENLKAVMDAVNAVKSADYTIEFDPSLVRGMSYYTGTIFEIEMKEFSSSVAGGGRYDAMIGNFTGNPVPACGFSIGFERIMTILADKGYKPSKEKTKTAFLVEKGTDAAKLGAVMKEADLLRKEGNAVRIDTMAKNKKFQKESLAALGYTEFKEFYNN